jgi:hypothetical protein
MATNTKTKVSAAQASSVYAEVPGVLRALSAERNELRTKLASANKALADYQKRDRIEKIAQRMEDRHIDIGVPRSERVEKIKEACARGRSLDAIEEAIEMTAPSGEFAKVAEDMSGNGVNQLESYLLGGVAD